MEPQGVTEGEWEQGWDAARAFMMSPVRGMFAEVTRYFNDKEWGSDDPVEREILAREMWRRIQNLAKKVDAGG